MKQRTTAPAANNKFYLKKPYGYNPCILGNKKHRQYPHSVLVNCVGYCTGRMGETSGAKACKYLGNTNAENFITLAKKQGLATGNTPRPGAVMVWSSAGAGHAAFVEWTNWEDEVVTSESGWGYTMAYITNKTRKKGSGNWGQNSNYKFLGFIYNPNVEPYPTPAKTAIRYGDSGNAVRWVQWAIKRSGYSVAVDGKFGPTTKKALKKFQKKYKLEPDGVAGPKTQEQIKTLYCITS